MNSPENTPGNETQPKIDGNNLDPEQLKKELEEQQKKETDNSQPVNSEGNTMDELKKEGKEVEEAPKDLEIKKENVPTEVPGNNGDPSK